MSTATAEAVVQEQRHNETSGTLQLVSFRLAQEEYGIEITEVDLVGRLASLEALARHLHREATA